MLIVSPSILYAYKVLCEVKKEDSISMLNSSIFPNSSDELAGLKNINPYTYKISLESRNAKDFTT